nr:ribosome recycling factor [Sodalis sp. CWE]
MKQCTDTFKNHIRDIHTGRASPSLLANIPVNCYGTIISLNKLANIAVEDSHTLIITVFDYMLVASIEKAIMTSHFGLNPNSNGKIIRVPLPSLTKERRLDLIKVIRSEAECGRIAIRKVRRDVNEKLKELLKDKTICEDEHRRLQDDIQKLTNFWISNLDAVLSEKEAELIEI